MDTGLVSIFS